MGRSSSSSSRAAGGVNGSGNPNDTVIVIGGDGRKGLLTLSWAFSALGGAIPNMCTSRIAVVDADISQSLSGNLATGLTATGNDPIAAIAGRILFDTQVTGGIAAGQALPTAGQFIFPTDPDAEGRVESSGGPITIIMTAPVQAANAGSLTFIQGVLVAQYAIIYDTQGRENYAYPKRSGPAR